MKTITSKAKSCPMHEAVLHSDEAPAVNADEKGSVLKTVPVYILLCTAVMLLAQLTAYYGFRRYPPEDALHNMVSKVDYSIPVRPAWITVYFLAFFSWIFSGIMILAENKLHGCRFAGTYVIGMLISGMIFLIWPSTMTRPELSGTGFWWSLLRLLYRIDAPRNLFPSMHVLISYFCWRGTLGCRKIPKWYQWFNLGFLILVCFSILFIKQHQFLDVPSALLLGELSWQLSAAVKSERVMLALEKKVLLRAH